MIFDPNAKREQAWRNSTKARALVGELGFEVAEQAVVEEVRSAGFHWRRRAHWRRILKLVRVEGHRIELMIKRNMAHG